MLRFSGHDTFHCREKWLTKGVQLIDDKGFNYLNQTQAIVDLGVGKNMVRAITHWLKAFNLYSSELNQLTVFGEKFFLEDGFDPFLENEATLWLLQYQLCTTGYASIYPLIFNEFFQTKASNDFSQLQVIQFLKRYIIKQGEKVVSENTLNSDFKVFIKSYVTPSKTTKNIEDDFGAPLLPLNLITIKANSQTESFKQYSINKRDEISLPIEVFAFCVLDLYKNESIIKMQSLQTQLGNYFTLTTGGLISYLEKLSDLSNAFSFKQDAGVQQLQINYSQISDHYNFLKDVYEK